MNVKYIVTIIIVVTVFSLGLVSMSYAISPDTPPPGMAVDKCPKALDVASDVAISKSRVLKWCASQVEPPPEGVQLSLDKILAAIYETFPAGVEAMAGAEIQLPAWEYVNGGELASEDDCSEGYAAVITGGAPVTVIASGAWPKLWVTGENWQLEEVLDITYTCSGESVTFPLNDQDLDQISDLVENRHRFPDFLQNSAYIKNAGLDMYCMPFDIIDPSCTVPNGLIVGNPYRGMHFLNTDDAAQNFDQDTILNGDEITNGTNLFVTQSLATFPDALSAQPFIYAFIAELAAFDYDKDNDLDVAVANDNMLALSIAKNEGGQWIEEFYISTGIPTSVAVGDFNRDGLHDAVMAETVIRYVNGSYVYENSVEVFLFKPLGGVSSQVITVSSYVPQNTLKNSKVATADFNGDLCLDVALVTPDPDEITVIPGNCLGGFGVPVKTSLNYNVLPIEIRKIANADLDEDGNMDLVIVSEIGVTYAWGLGNTSFICDTATLNLNNYKSVAIADLDGDRILDIVMIIDGSNGMNLAYRKGLGDRAFSGLIGLTPFLPSTDSDLAVADLDGDNDLDLALLTYDDNYGSITWIYRNVSGSFISNPTPDIIHDSMQWYNRQKKIIAADFNNDSKIDLAAGIEDLMWMGAMVDIRTNQ